MAGGGNIRIVDEGDVTKGGRGARVRDHRVWVDATITGGVTITPPLNVRLQDGLGADVVTVLRDSQIASPTGQAAGVMAAGLAKTPSLSGIVSVNDLAFLRSDLAGNLLVSNFMRDPVTVSNVCNVPCDNDAAAESVLCGIAPMFEQTTGFQSITDGVYHHAFLNKSGEILVTARISDQLPGFGATNLGKKEDNPHANQDVGVMALAVRTDTAASRSGTDGDYNPLQTDAKGALWTREVGVTTLALSGSARGKPIQIVAVATLGTTIHVATTTAGELDRVYIDLANTHTATVTVSIEFGAAGVGNEMPFIIPAGETVHAVVGDVIGGGATDTITAYASVASVVNATGRVERLSA